LNSNMLQATTMEKIKNIIFDLGGVILNIDMKKTELALQQLGINGFHNLFSPSTAFPFFREYEAGKINNAEFIRSIQSLISKSTGEQEVINAWNALLLDFPPERIELLKKLRKKYRLFLLSNTNAIHHQQFQEQLYQQTGNYLEDFFEKAYYSHAIGLCKPDVACYQYVISENNLDPAETLFVDDSEANIKGAIEAGLSVLHIKPGVTILDAPW
jgi:glucose-1-phosphatase